MKKLDIKNNYTFQYSIMYFSWNWKKQNQSMSLQNNENLKATANYLCKMIFWINWWLLMARDDPINELLLTNLIVI